MFTESRLRKCCPVCSSVNVGKHRKHSGNYKCASCKAIFASPATKEIKTHSGIPKSLKVIIEKKRIRR